MTYETPINLALASLAFIVIVCGCKKAASKKPPSIISTYISRMGNVRNWHGIDQGTGDWQDTPYHPYSNIVAYTFALSANGPDSTVTLNSNLSQWIPMSGVYKYTSSDTATKTIFFKPDPWGSITYYYEADSIVINGAYGGIHGEESLYLKTP